MADTDPSSPRLAELWSEVGRALGRANDVDDLTAELMRLADDPLLLGAMVGRARQGAVSSIPGHCSAEGILTVIDRRPGSARVSHGIERFEVDALGSASLYPEPFKPSEDEVAGAVDLSCGPVAIRREQYLVLATILVVLVGLLVLFIS